MNKFKILLLSIFLFFLGAIIVIAKTNDLKLNGKVFVIDPGHGGKDVGTFYKNIYEKDINLSIL